MNESLNHDHYENLCALAALGQISAEKYVKLNNHLRSCTRCQAAYTSFCRLLQTQFLEAEKQGSMRKKLADFCLRNKRHKRFLSRARELGFGFSTDTEARRPLWDKLSGLSLPSVSWAYASVFIIIVLASLVGILGQQWRESLARNAAQSIETARLGEENTNLLKANSNFRQQVAALQREMSSLAMQLSAVRDEKATRENQLEAELLKASLALQGLKAELESTSEIANSKLQDARQTLHAMALELQSLRQARSKDASVIEAQQIKLAELTQKVQEQADMLERERRLMVADRDIRELMGARNLHIHDVVDVDSRGTNKRTFGRVFYTEGKSLIFYAFDLEEAGSTNAKHSFQAWGERKGHRGSTVSLGIFYVDNAEQRRWVLKFEDPAVLRQINAVFVTVEPFGGGQRPTGEKLLYAYLSNKRPNHP